MKKYKQPYEQGYYDGYEACKNFYQQLLIDLADNRDYYKERVEILDYQLLLRRSTKKDREDEELISIGKAVKALMKESQNDC